MNFRKGQDPFSSDKAVEQAAEKILGGASVDGALRHIHIGNGMDTVNDMLVELAEETHGETRCRLLMAQKCVLDSIEQFDSERTA